MERRLVERDDARAAVRQAADFKVRSQAVSRAWIVVGFVGSVGILFLVVNLALRGELLSPATHGVIAAAMLAFLVFIFYRLFWRVSLAEFQCLVFAAALRSDTLFCLVFRPDGTLFYRDERMRHVFPDGEADTLATVLAHDGIEGGAVDTLEEALRQDATAVVRFRWADADGDTRHATLTLTQLSRPRGYFALKAHDA